jgi:hypothetical protein
MMWQKRILSTLLAGSSLVATGLTAHPFELQDDYYVLSKAPTYKDYYFDKSANSAFLLPKQKGTKIKAHKKLKLVFEGKKGETGSRGAQGPQGVQGVQGIQGIQGVPGPVNFLARNNFFVDLTTTQDQLTADGTIAKPFSTIQGAINYIQLHHTPTNVQDFETGTTLLIAAGWYQEQVTITGDSNRITLVPLGNVILGPASGSLPAIVYNVTSSNTNFGSQYRTSLAFGTTSPDRGNASSINDLSPSVPSFHLRFGMTATSGSSIPSDIVFNGVETGSVTATSTINALNLFFYSSLCDSVILVSPTHTPPATVVIANASKTSFEGLVTIDSFYSAEDCVFRGGLTLIQNDTATSLTNKDRIGFRNCQFYGGTIDVTAAPALQKRLFVDAFTNAWIRHSGGTTFLSYSAPSLAGGVKLDAIADLSSDS